MDWVITYYYHYYLSYAFVQVIDMSCLLARDVYAMCLNLYVIIHIYLYCLAMFLISYGYI